MKDNKFYVEIDVDGVIGNMDGSYTEYVNHIIPDFNEEDHIKSWGMLEVQRDFPEVYQIVRGLYTNPEFIRTLPRYSNVEKHLKDIYEVVNSNNGIIAIHTHILAEDCSIERENWLIELRNDTDIDFEIDICVGANKGTRTNSFIIIEDNVNNLTLSNAPYKILVRRGHNRLKGLNDIGTYEQAFIVPDLSEVSGIIEQILSEQLLESAVV